MENEELQIELVMAAIKLTEKMVSKMAQSLNKSVTHEDIKQSAIELMLQRESISEDKLTTKVYSALYDASRKAYDLRSKTKCNTYHISYDSSTNDKVKNDTKTEPKWHIDKRPNHVERFHEKQLLDDIYKSLKNGESKSERLAGYVLNLRVIYPDIKSAVIAKKLNISKGRVSQLNNIIREHAVRFK